MSRVSGVAALVRAMILRAELAPGGRLVEVQLAERLGVGRSTLREALRRLEGEGLLVANHAGGMRVIALDADDLADTLRVRVELEALAAGLAAGRVRDGDVAPDALRELRRLADAASASGGAPAGGAVLADRHLHRAITALGASRACSEALERIWDRLVLAAATAVPGAARIAAADREHHALVQAIAAGEAQDAATVARTHVLAALG